MPRGKRRLTWTHLYDSWLEICKGLGSLVLADPDFMEISTPYVPGYALHIPVDWWPRTGIQDRIAFYSSTSRTKTNPYHTKAGLVHTASLLRDAKTYREQQHAVYMLASVRDKEKTVPEAWHGDPYRLVSEVQNVIRARYRELDYWHTASRQALPIQILPPYAHASDMMVPETADDLMYIAALEASLSAATWQLITYVQEPTQSLRVVK